MSSSANWMPCCCTDSSSSSSSSSSSGCYCTPKAKGIEISIDIGGEEPIVISIPFVEGVMGYYRGPLDPLILDGNYDEFGERTAKYESTEICYLACGAGYGDTYKAVERRYYQFKRQAWRVIDRITLSYEFEITYDCRVVGNVSAEWRMQRSSKECDSQGNKENITLWSTSGTDWIGDQPLALGSCYVEDACVEEWSDPDPTFEGTICCPNHGCADPYFYTITGTMYSNDNTLFLEECDFPDPDPTVSGINQVIQGSTTAPRTTFDLSFNQSICDYDPVVVEGDYNDITWDWTVEPLSFLKLGEVGVEDICLDEILLPEPELGTFNITVKLYE